MGLIYVFLVTRCEALVPPVSGSLNTTQVDFQTYVMASCDKGYIFSDPVINNKLTTSIVATCSFGEWSREYPTSCIGMDYVKIINDNNSYISNTFPL